MARRTLIMDINFQDIIRLLGPGSGQVLVWSIFLYIIFFFGMLTLFTIPDKNMVPTLLLAVVLLFAIVGKLSVSSPVREAIIKPKDFGMFVINVGMFVFPLIAVGMVRSRKSKATIPALITALTAAVYFFLYWLVAQH
ncbi:MAG: hypothetical protein ABI835_05365 [Chloroflexota bacterium]